MTLKNQDLSTIKELFKKIYFYKQCVHKLVALCKPFNEASDLSSKEEIFNSIDLEANFLEEKKSNLRREVHTLKRKIQEFLKDPSISFLITKKYYILTNSEGVLYSLPIEEVEKL